MNTGNFTGWVHGHGDTAYSPTGECHLLFTVVIETRKGDGRFLRCEVDDPDLIKKSQRLLTPGRIVVGEYELDVRPTYHRGVQAGSETFLRLHVLEFPDRSNPLPALLAEPVANEPHTLANAA